MKDFLKDLGLETVGSGAYAGKWLEGSGDVITSETPADGSAIARVRMADLAEYDRAVEASAAAFQDWRKVPAPVRGEYVRQIGEVLREYKEPLGKLVTYEMGKIYTEGLGEVQEMIDMADFAVGLSRQLYGSVMQSERPEHRMYEHWHPLGPVGVITAFNFPVAVWAWNAFLAAVCGDTVLWKPSPNTPLCALAVQNLVNKVMEGTGHEGVFTLAVGGADVGRAMAEDRRLPLISFTGSIPVGGQVGQAVSARYGKSILELGGNNAVIVMDDANMENALRAVAFGAVGTAGQRCTSTRRVLLHKDISDKFVDGLLKAYPTIPIGDPLDPATLIGPVINAQAIQNYEAAIAAAKAQGGEVLYGGSRIDRPGFYVEPTIIKGRPNMDIICTETFAPILYLMEFSDLEEAIEIHNSVPQGLSSSIFTESMRNAETFLSYRGSDCGIANVNIGTSGAEIGGAFGGEKETGGGREAGSDAWKAYMRRQTSTINWGEDMPLAQGVEFNV